MRVLVGIGVIIASLAAGAQPSVGSADPCSRQATRGVVNFAGILTRAATDLRPTRYRYKGATTCAASAPRLVVWSMAAARS
jgi:hypothetical protein